MNHSIFSTASLTAGQRATYWATLVCDTFVELDCHVPAPDTFSGQISCFQASTLQFFQIASSPHVVTRTRSRIARSAQDDFLFILQTAGRGYACQGGRTAITETGDFTLIDTTRPYDLRFDQDFSQIVMRLPRGHIMAKLAEAEDLTARLIDGKKGMGRLASSFLQQLPAVSSEIDPRYLARVQDSAIDLITAAVAERAAPAPHQGGRHLTLRRKISAYIDRHLSDTELSCTSIAAAHGISARHLSKIHEKAGIHVSQLIWSRRLQQARQDLADPLQAHKSITVISHDAGFKDAGHFSRLFKSALDETPRAFRARMLSD